jgi:hypothetical protein
MTAEIIKLDQDLNFKPTTNALLIPEFKNLWTKVENPEIYFCYIHCMLYPVSVFSNLPESEKEAAVLADYPIDKMNPYFILAYDKAEKLYETPLKRGFLSAKIVYDTLVHAMSSIGDIGITYGKDGNYSDVTSFLSKASGFMQSYVEVENRYKEETAGWGGRELDFDEKTDYGISTLDLN